MGDRCVWCLLGKHNKEDRYARTPCTCNCHMAPAVADNRLNITKPIPTLSGRFVTAEYKGNIGIVVKQTNGSTVSRIVLSKDSARDLSNQLMVASIEAERGQKITLDHPAIISDEEGVA